MLLNGPQNPTSFIRRLHIIKYPDLTAPMFSGTFRFTLFFFSLDLLVRLPGSGTMSCLGTAPNLLGNPEIGPIMPLFIPRSWTAVPGPPTNIIAIPPQECLPQPQQAVVANNLSARSRLNNYSSQNLAAGFTK